MESLIFYTEKALQDMAANRLLNLMTILTISLCTLMMGTLILFYENGSRLIHSWSRGGEVIVYLNAGLEKNEIELVRTRLTEATLTHQVRFISKSEALADLKKDLPPGTTYLNHLEGNPLPDAFIVTMAVEDLKNEDTASSPNIRDIKDFADYLSQFEYVESVAYGETWLNSLTNIQSMFALSGYVVMSLFFLVILFVVGNTVKLTLFARHEEFTIMRLVGATERFMAIPFYIASMIQGGVGALIGLLTLGLFFRLSTTTIDAALLKSITASHVVQAVTSSPSLIATQITFLSPLSIPAIIASGIFLGWTGCFLSLSKHLKP